MSLSISVRPTKNVNSLYESNVNSVHLPMQYQLDSDLFPTNTSDTTFSVTSVATNALGATFTTSVAHGYTALNWVTLSGFSELGYNGNWQIISVPSTTTFVVGAAFTSTDTGNAVRYYNNYHAKIQIYA